jgi:hypothetical protein
VARAPYGLGAWGPAPTTNFRVGRVSSAADRLHQQSCCAEFPFPVLKLPTDHGGKWATSCALFAASNCMPIIEVERRCGEPGTVLLGTQNGRVTDSTAASKRRRCFFGCAPPLKGRCPVPRDRSSPTLIHFAPACSEPSSQPSLVVKLVTMHGDQPTDRHVRIDERKRNLAKRAPA